MHTQPNNNIEPDLNFDDLHSAEDTLSSDDVLLDIDGDLDAAELDLLLEEPPAKAGAKRSRKIEVVSYPEGTVVSVYQRLIDYGLLRKVTDIVMAKVQMPWHLRADATQEVHAVWASKTAKLNFARNQLANYAFMSGKHAALKLRRDIGAVVVLPGNIFRTGRDSAFMESIGAAVNPKDVEDYKDSIELAVEPVDIVEHAPVTDILFLERIAPLALNPKHQDIAYRALVQKKNSIQIAEELDLQRSYIERVLNQVAKRLIDKDNGVVYCPPSQRTGRGATTTKRASKKRVSTQSRAKQE